jgi:hypothetical protein
VALTYLLSVFIIIIYDNKLLFSGLFMWLYDEEDEMKCRHEKSWMLHGNVEWCNECGAFRYHDVTEKGFVPQTSWCYLGMTWDEWDKKNRAHKKRRGLCG